MQSAAERIAEITETPTSTPDPLHDVMDTAKRDALAADMEANGWVGAPVVVLSETQALTGAHRIAAAAKADVNVPQVSIEDLCGICGLEWSAVRAEHGGDHGDDWYAAAAALRNLLPAEVVEYLGYDVDGA